MRKVTAKVKGKATAGKAVPKGKSAAGATRRPKAAKQAPARAKAKPARVAPGGRTAGRTQPKPAEKPRARLTATKTRAGVRAKPAAKRAAAAKSARPARPAAKPAKSAKIAKKATATKVASRAAAKPAAKAKTAAKARPVLKSVAKRPTAAKARLATKRPAASRRPAPAARKVAPPRKAVAKAPPRRTPAKTVSKTVAKAPPKAPPKAPARKAARPAPKAAAPKAAPQARPVAPAKSPAAKAPARPTPVKSPPKPTPAGGRAKPSAPTPRDTKSIIHHEPPPPHSDSAVLLRRPQVETPTVSARVLAEATARITARRARDMLPVRIQTRRLVLRAPIRGDVPDLVKHADNPNIAKWLARLPSPYTRADAIAFVEIFSQRADQRPFVITLDNQLIGVVGFTYREGHPPEVGYWIGEACWGHGYATEAVRGLIDAAHQTGLYGLIAARCLEDNIASIKVLESAGFKRVGKVLEDHGPEKRKILTFELEAPRWT